MNSRGDSGDGFVQVPVENQEFQVMGSWTPVTPRRPKQDRSSLVVDGWVPGGGFCKDVDVQDSNFVEQREDLLGRSNVASSQAGYTGFNMDDLLPFSFTSLLSHFDHLYRVSQCGTSAPLYNFDSPPTREAVGYICPSSLQSVPSKPSLCRTGWENGFLTEQKSDKSFVDSSVVNLTEDTELKNGSRQNDLMLYLGKAPPKKQRFKKRVFMPTREAVEDAELKNGSRQNDLMLYLGKAPPKKQRSKERVFMPTREAVGQENGFLTEQKSDKSFVDWSVVNSRGVTELKDVSRQNDLMLYLGNIPQKKQRSKKRKFIGCIRQSSLQSVPSTPSPCKTGREKKRKFKPKVFVEGKHIRKPLKPASHKKLKPKAGGSGKRKKPQISLKKSSTNKPAIGGDFTNTSLEVTQKSCRKSLNFVLEKTGDVGQGDSVSECISSQERSNAESFDVCNKTISQNSSFPTPARGSKRQYEHAMGHMQNSVARRNSNTCAKHLDVAKKMKIQKAVQENLHGMSPEVIDIEGDPTDGTRKDKSTASTNEKCHVPKTPAKTRSSRSKAKDKGMKSKKDSGKESGPSEQLLREDCIAEKVCSNKDESREQEQNALVLYRGDGAVVPYEKKLKPRDKVLKPRAKVHLDDETTREWSVSDGERRKRWVNLHSILSTSGMAYVTGDRRFSPWKGSMVDSVIGVFLTQNVTDHFSSSAFMSLAARFPPKPSSKQEDERNIRSVVVEDPEGSILNLEEKVLSSQDSFDPASWIFQSCGRVGSCSSSKSDAEFSTEESVKIGCPDLSNEICRQGNDRSLLHGESGDVQIKETANGSQKKPDTTADLVDIEEFGMNFLPKNSTLIREMEAIRAARKKPTSQWDSLRRDVLEKKGKKERSKDSMDSIDYEAIRRASVHEISDAIKERGMNDMLAARIKDFLERIVKDHGAVDLEWLRDVPPDKAKDYLLSVRGLGLKSVECVQLLTLHNLAFPVDTNVGRIAVRLGWVPLQPLPESLQLHLLELYPVIDSIQKFLWPRLCKLDQPTLYELHYQMITFGKVFCSKKEPNCNACPMRGECRHFASAYASARLALPAREERILTSATVQVAPEFFPPAAIQMVELPPSLESFLTREAPSNGGSSESIIEEPATPEQEFTEITESDIEDAYYNEDPDEIPTIAGDMFKALVALDPSTTSIPTPKLKNISRLRTEHQVYELRDSHRLLAGMDKREPDDPNPYLLAIWTPECNSVREANSQTVIGTLLVPSRTAMRGRFPLNGTYFQVNEVFADHASSLEPIDVPRDWLWDLPRRTVYFGTSTSSIFRGMSTAQIQYCFRRGFVCVRGFEHKTRAPRPLFARLHFPSSKLKNKT
ncbi:hypothetical protein HID58_057642 [Brassica napus]|uniref:HhH-GPD domain-containing protein n=1 Tax=Brassica napus TaxID=3708 RepID=A0ABQ8ARX4_BRANA|nr:hypothetical protein HID58_057642 [Brassica napus]